jgi:hypothetical protein
MHGTFLFSFVLLRIPSWSFLSSSYSAGQPKWKWLIDSDAGLAVRLCIGLSIFAVLATVDLRRNGRRARRWREYAFLLAAVAVAMIYGVVNDQITSAISWEYFYYGKELSTVLGPRIPPDRAALHWAAAKIGMKATWSVGLLLGVALLIANNPRPGRTQLPFRQLLRFLPGILLLTVSCAILMGLAGCCGALNWCSADFRMMAQTNLFRPSRFLATWGAHLGGYIGGLLGGILSVMRVLALRRRAGVATIAI